MVRNSLPSAILKAVFLLVSFSITYHPFMASNLYLLPCAECQHPLEVQTRQAGQTLNCPQCNHSFDAPRLGELKRLQPVSSEGSPHSGGGSTSILKRWLFTAGLAMAVLLGAAGFGVYQYASSIQQEIDAEGAMELYETDIDKLTDAQVYQVAAAYDTDQSIGEYFQPDAVKSNKQGEILEYVAFGLMGLGAVGLLMLVASFLVK